MKIAVTSSGKSLDSEIDPRFGRTKYFIIVDPDSMEYEVVENKQNLNLPQGAGIQAGKIIANNNVDAVITGNCGPKAFKVLKEAKIKIIMGNKGTVSEAVSLYKNGKLKEADDANVEGHWV